METFISIILSIAGFAVDRVFDALVWFVAWFILFIVTVAAYWVTFAPAGALIGKFVPRKFERLHILKGFINKLEERSVVVAMVIAVITFPIFIYGHSNVSESLDNRRKESHPHEVVDGYEVRSYKLIALTSPKHVYVTIEDVKSGNVYDRLYVSKHCNNHSANKLGDTYNIQIRHYHMSNDPDRKFISFLGMPDVFCG